MQSKPSRLLNLKTRRRRIADGPSTKIDLDLFQKSERSGEQDLQIFDLDGGFFTQLAAQCLLRLLTFGDKAARQCPSCICAEHMFEQEHTAFIIEQHDRNSDGKARLAKFRNRTAHRDR